MARPGTFPPGNNANPRGRPKKGTALTDLLRTYLNAKDPETLVARKRLLAEELYRRAVGGWVADPSNPERREYVRGSDDMLRYLYDRIDGKPTQGMEHSGEGGGPIRFSNLSQDERERLLAEELARRTGE